MNVKNFDGYLDDPQQLERALASLDLTPKEMADLETLFRTPSGVPVKRDKNNVARGGTVRASSSIGKKLTEHFNGVGPQDFMMWIGLFISGPDGVERWVLREELRTAIEQLRWFDQMPSTTVPFIQSLGTNSALPMDPKVASSSPNAEARAARLERLRNAPVKPEKISVTRTEYVRNPDVVSEVLFRADGICEKCGKDAPFDRELDGC